MTQQSAVASDPNYRSVLDHGFIGLIDYMGSDSAIVQAARVSYGAGTKTVNEDRGLIRYLLRHEHTTPFEMAELKFHVRAPLFVIRQWFRHRTASVNEESGRYSEMSDEFFVPALETIQPQSSDNKQGRSGTMALGNQAGARWMMEAAYETTYDVYKALLGDKVGRDPEHPGRDIIFDPYKESEPLWNHDFNGIAREIARVVLPVGVYSEFYWKLNLHNLFRFLRLRADSHAQYEIRVFAEAICELARPHFPAAFEAWDDYVAGAVSLSRMEMELLHALMHTGEVGFTPVEALFQMTIDAGGVRDLAVANGMSVREMRDFAERFKLQGALEGATQALVGT